MANNPYKNKVVYDGTTLIDLTEDTVNENVLWYGYTAHRKDGAVITGTYRTTPMIPIEYDYNIGYITNGAWVYENPTNTYTDFYEVEAGHTYFITLGENVGSRFRSMFTTTDVRTVTSGRVTGTKIIDTNNPASYASIIYRSTSDGYVLVAKDNVGKYGLYSYVFDTYYLV